MRITAAVIAPAVVGTIVLVLVRIVTFSGGSSLAVSRAILGIMAARGLLMLYRGG